MFKNGIGKKNMSLKTEKKKWTQASLLNLG